MNAGRVVPPRLPYQPALDGLRALAVLAVMVFHQQYLGGGFLGVDVFFVLSGFLITSLLLIDHAKTGKVISLGFWRRRARRLFPAILVLLVIVALYAATVAKPVDLGAIRRGSLATLLYVQNYWLIHRPRDFFSPLNHTWSLSIEEQFYLVWPILLALLVRFARLGKWLVAAVIALALGSAALMAARYTHTHLTNSAYVSTETRAQELLVGAALAIVLLGRRVSGLALQIAGTIAFALLVVAVFTAGHFEPFLYEGGFFLIAIAAAVLIAAVMADGTSPLRTALSWKPLIWIGLISYGLYLYHVPLYSFVDAQHVVTADWALIVMRFGLSLIVAAASFLLIERPIRHGALVGKRLVVAAPAAVAAVLAFVLLATSGAAGPPPTELQALVFSKARTATPPGTDRVLVAGDSLASSLVSFSMPEYVGSGIHGVVQWASKCDSIAGDVAVGNSVLPPAKCFPYQQSYLSAVFSFQPDVSVLVLGPTAVFDRVVAGQKIDVGSPIFRTFLFARLDSLRGLLTSRGAAFVLTTVPCMTPPATGALAGFAAVQRDPRRIDTINQILRDYARERHVAIADLGQLVCTHPEYLSAGGTTFKPAGAVAAWQLLAPIARAARTNDH